MKPFNLEAFKAGQKAVHVNSFSKDTVSFLTVSSKGLIVFEYDDGVVTISTLKAMEDCYVMVSRHQQLIDSHDPEDTWQILNPRLAGVGWRTTGGEPTWEEYCNYRLHPHNDLIKAWKKGAKIEACISSVFIEVDNPEWSETITYRIKPEPTIHCLCYNPGHVHGEFSWSPSLATKQLAIKNGWTIIQEWEV